MNRLRLRKRKGTYLERICTAKLPFPNRTAAKKWVKRNAQPDWKPQQAYECPVCGQWHLTTHRKEKP